MRIIFTSVEKQLIHSIVQENSKHARFLNTLSLMELCGAKRLSSLLPSLGGYTFFLEHVAEEYRHAYFLRRLASKIINMDIDSFDDDKIYCPRISKGYIRNLDRHVLLLLNKFGVNMKKGRSYLPYILTTFIIEQRALLFYESYQALLDEEGIGISVKSIIKEEKDHLLAMDEALKKEDVPKALFESCYKIETKLWSTWITHLTRAII